MNETRKFLLKKYHRAVEWDKIRRVLSEQTACSDAADLALSLEPETTLSGAQRLLQETDDAYLLMARFGSPSFHGLASVVNTVRRAQSGGVLNCSELLQVAGVLRTMRGVAEWRHKSEGMKTTLDWRFDSLAPNKILRGSDSNDSGVGGGSSRSCLSGIGGNPPENPQCLLPGSGTAGSYDPFHCVSKILTGHNCHHAGRPLCGAG